MRILKREKTIGGVKFVLFEKEEQVKLNSAIPSTIVSTDTPPVTIFQQQTDFNDTRYTTLDVVKSEILSSLENFHATSIQNQFQFPVSQPKDNDIIQFDGSSGQIKWSELPIVRNYDSDILDINNTFIEYESEFDSEYIKTRTIHFKFDAYARDNGLQWQDHDKPLEGYYGVMMGRGTGFVYYGPDQHGVGDLNSLVMRFSTGEDDTPKGRGFLWSTIGGAAPGYHGKMALDTQNGWLTINRGITLALTGDPMQAAPLQNIPYLNIVFMGHGPETANYVPLYDYNQQRLRLYPQSAITSGITGGPGTSELSGLTDVALSALTNGHALTYNSSTGKWQNSTPAEGVTDHELLTGLSGGSANNRYHLSELAYSALTSGGSANAFHVHNGYTTDFIFNSHNHSFSAITNTGHTHMLTATTRPWDGKVCGAYGDGDPGRLLEMCQSNGVVSPSPTNIGTGTARCSYFILQSDLVVNKIRFYGVGNNANIMRCAIYDADTLDRLTSELYFDTVATSWGFAGSSLNLTLNAGKLYLIAVAASATSTTAAVLSMGPNLGALTGQIQVLPKSYPGNLNLSSGYVCASFCQFSLSSPGSLPTTASTIAFPAAWTGGMPAFWLDNDND